MSLPARLLPTVATVTRPGQVLDRYGSLVDDWGYGYATTFTILCRVQQVTRDEQDDETRDAAIGTHLLLTNTLTLAAGDRVTAAGTTYEVDGPPAIVQTAAADHHLEATVRLVAG
mgnify:CR=1 FL=1